MCNGGEASWARIIAPVGGDSASHLSAVELTLIWIWISEQKLGFISEISWDFDF